MIGFLAALIPIVTNAITTLATLAPKIAPWLLEGAKVLLNIIGKELPIIIDSVEKASDILEIIKKEETNSYDLGIRSTETDKRPEDFDSIQEYIKFLTEEVKCDKKNHSESEVLCYKAIGGKLLMKGIEEKIELNTNPDFWLEVSRNKLSEREIIEILKEYKKNNLELDFADYLNGKLIPKEEQTRGEMLVNILVSLNPESSKEEIENRLMKMENNTQTRKEFEYGY